MRRSRWIRGVVADLSLLRLPLQHEWVASKNTRLLPSNKKAGSPTPASTQPDVDTIVQVQPLSPLQVWWRCSTEGCGHEWMARVSARKDGEGCPACLERSSLFRQVPDAVADFDTVKNSVGPSDIAVDDERKIWWTCARCGGGWKESAASRTRRAEASDGVNTCFRCEEEGQGAASAVPQTVAAHPRLASEIIPREDEDLSELPCRSPSSRRWECSTCGHKFTMSVYDRAVLAKPCPSCSGTGKEAPLLIDARPDIAASLLYMNREKARKLTVMDRTQVRFGCKRCNGVYRMSVRERVMRNSCPMCKYTVDTHRRKQPDSKVSDSAVLQRSGRSIPLHKPLPFTSMRN